MLKKIMLVSAVFCFVGCKARNDNTGSANLEAAAAGKKIWSCVGRATITSSGKSTQSLVRISVFNDGKDFTQVQLYQAASGAASTWKSSSDSAAFEDDETLKIANMKLVGAGAKLADKTKGAFFNLNINKTKPATGPEYKEFLTYNYMKGFEAEVSFTGISVVGSWVQQFTPDSANWVCSNQKQYL